MEPFTERTPRVIAARKLTRRSEREKAGRFLAEGSNAVSSALARERENPGFVHELFLTASAHDHHQQLAALAHELKVRVSFISDRAAAALSETVTPQGIVAVCARLDRPLATVFRSEIATGESVTADPAAASPALKLVAVLVGVTDPGNAGTVIRVADAAGADAVVLAGDSVDPYNGKCVRASAGSLFQVPLVRARDVDEVFTACRKAGLLLFAAHGYADVQLDEVDLSQPTAWVFGNEARGLPEHVLTETDRAVRIPLYGKAESLNLATAAAVCLYTSAMANRRDAP